MELEIGEPKSQAILVLQHFDLSINKMPDELTVCHAGLDHSNDIRVLLHLVPFALVRAVAPRFEGIGKTTTSLYRILVGLPFYGAWYVVSWFALRYYSNATIATASVVAMPMLGIFTFHYWIF